MAIFGCCSRFIECSDNRACVHADDPYYLRCYYRKHLEAGRIFYGINCNTGKRANTIHETVSDVTLPVPESKGREPDTQENFDKSLFLHCLGRVFAIYARQKNLWSTAATPEQISSLEKAFDETGIPYKPEIDNLNECVIDRPTEEDPAPANSRVVFEVGGQEYHVLNYNSWLIKQAIAERIAKAFENHYINARVEIRGQRDTSNIYTYRTKPEQRPLATAETQKKILQGKDTKETKIHQEEKAALAAALVQTSIFEICTEQFLNESPDVCPEAPKTKSIESIEQKTLIDATPEALNTDLLDPSRQLIIADDKYCGAYTGEFIKLRRMQMDYRFVHIKIVDMLRPPRQDAVYNTSAIVHRDPYPIGSEQVFDIADVRLAFKLEASNV